MKKFEVKSEFAYIISIVVLAFSVAIMSAVDFGVSMIVAPAYILSLKFDFLTFGQCEYIVQALLFIVFCILVKKIKPQFFFSFITCIIYGAVLDFFRAVIPILNPSIYPPGSFNIILRVVFFIVAELLTAFAVALCFKTYLYPQVNDFIVKGLSTRFNLDRNKFKRIYDFMCLSISVLLSLILFKNIKGIGIGTVVLTLINGVLIGFFDKILSKLFEFNPMFKNFAKGFDV